MGQLIELREIPRGQLEQSLEAAARGLHADPGAAYRGDCDMFRGSHGLPVCRGQCKGGGTCHLVIIGIEGSHSDIYDYLVLCTCLSGAQIDKLIKGRAQTVTLPGKESGPKSASW